MWKQSNASEAPVAPAQAFTKPTMSPSSAASESPLARTALGSHSFAEQSATIGKSLVVKGELTGSESLYIDGKVEGSISLPGNRVTIGRNGHVTASIVAREVVVQGKLFGNVTASDRLEVRSEGSLTGDVVAQRISVEDGAFFKGKIDIRRPNPAAEEASTKEPMLTEAMAASVA